MSLFNEDVQALSETQWVADYLARLERSREAASHEPVTSHQVTYPTSDLTMVTYRIGEPRPVQPLPVLPATHDLDKRARQDASYRRAVETYRDRERKRIREHRVAGR